MIVAEKCIIYLMRICYAVDCLCKVTDVNKHSTFAHILQIFQCLIFDLTAEVNHNEDS